MVEEKLLTPQEACEKNQLLRQLNGRLPSKEIDRRLDMWNNKRNAQEKIKKAQKITH